MIGQRTRWIDRVITIEPLDNGTLLVTIGCVRLSYSDAVILADDLKEYLANPVAREKEFNSGDDDILNEQPILGSREG